MKKWTLSPNMALRFCPKKLSNNSKRNNEDRGYSISRRKLLKSRKSKRSWMPKEPKKSTLGNYRQRRERPWSVRKRSKKRETAKRL